MALTLLGVAAISRRLSGTPVTPAMVFVAVGLLVGPEVLDGIDLESSSATVRTLAEATLALVLFSDASRIDLGQLRREVGRAGAPARDRAAADHRARRRRGGRHLRPADHRGGGHPRRWSWRRPTPRWGRRSSPSRASRGGSARGSTSRAGSTTGSASRCCSRPWRWPTWNRRSPRAAARERSCSRRSATGSSAAWSAGSSVAAIVIHAGRRDLIAAPWRQVIPAAGAALAYGTASALGGSGFIAAFVAGMTFRLALGRDPERDQRAQRAGGQRAQRRHLRALRGHPARPGARRAELGARAVRGAQPDAGADAPGRDRDARDRGPGRRRSASWAGSAPAAWPRSCSR